jgi:DNA-binding response OmpR family regulator
MEQREQENAKVRRDMIAQIDRWLDPDDSRPTDTEKAFGSVGGVFHFKGCTVRLPKKLATLMRALAVSSPGKWRTAKDLASQLGDAAKGVKPHTVAQAIYRLRKELQRAGLDGRMIESQRGYGWRWKAQDKG